MLPERLSRAWHRLMNRLARLPECSTEDCYQTAFYEADIYDGESDEPTAAPYCLICATSLNRGGHVVRELEVTRGS
jgi:hypothetical protein